jgi:hypothetical protein
MDRADVGVIERGSSVGFALKTVLKGRIIGRVFREDFDRDVAAEAGIVRSINLPHPARAEGGEYFVRAEAGTWGDGHGG